MRRFFILLLTLLSINSYAQLKVTNLYTDIEVARASRLLLDQTPVTVHYAHGAYSLRGATTSEFDIHFTLYLGKTKEEALQELTNLSKLSEKAVGMTLYLKELDANPIVCTVTDWTNRRSVKPSRTNQPGSKLVLRKAGYWGDFEITKKNLETLIRKLEKFKEE